MNDLNTLVQELSDAHDELTIARAEVPERELLNTLRLVMDTATALPECAELAVHEREVFRETLRGFPPALTLGLKGEWPTLRPVVLGMLGLVIAHLQNALSNAEMARLKQEEEEDEDGNVVEIEW